MPVESLELEPVEDETDDETESPELDPKELAATLEQGVLDNFEARDLAITPERFRALVPEIIIEDLKNHRAKTEFKLDELFAVAEVDGRIRLDQERFANLDQLQQRYVLHHELGHQLDWQLRHIEESRYKNILTSLEKMPSAQVSYYIATLEDKLTDDPDKTNKIGHEKMAELFAQYLSGDGTFAGMMKAKFLQFSGDQAEWSKEQESALLVHQLEDFESRDEEERAAFFAENPQIEAHYQLFGQLDELCHDAELMEEVVAERQDYDHDWYDYDDMVDQMVPTPKPPAKLPPQLANVKKPGSLNIFNLFNLS